MSETYSRVASASLIKEVTVGTPLTPTTFFPFVEEDIATEYAYTPAMPVSSNRAKNLRAIINKIPAPAGTLTVHIEPKTWGHFLNGVFGGVASGNYMPITSPSAPFTVGEVVTGGTSLKTATVVAYSAPEFLIVSGASGEFTDGETITGGTSGSTATLTEFDTTVYGHLGTLPDSSMPSYTMQFNYVDHAIRYIGMRFTGFDAVGQQDNILTAGIKVMALGQFRHAKVTAITTSGAGAKTITVDQTYGLVAADTVKLYRPGTGFMDFSATSVKTHTINAVASTTTFTVTNLEVSTAVGDLIMLAPQTASYTIGSEFPWIGGSFAYVGAAVASLAADTTIEDFSFVVDNEWEERHSATGNLVKDRFPATLLQKGLIGNGTINTYFADDEFYRNLRLHTAQALRVKSVGAAIGSTGLENEIWWTWPEVQFDPYQTNVSTDDIINEEIPFSGFYNTTNGYFARALLINDTASY